MMLTSLLLECVCLFIRVCLPASVYAVSEAGPDESHYGVCAAVREELSDMRVCVCVCLWRHKRS